MRTTNEQHEEALKLRVCQAVEDLDPQEAVKALKVALFPLEVMPEGERPTVVDRLIEHNLTTGLGFINWSVLAEAGTSGVEPNGTCKGGLTYGAKRTTGSRIGATSG